MFSQALRCSLCLIGAASGLLLSATEVHPDPIPPSSLIVEVRDVARIPNTSPGVTPRPTVMTQDPSGRLFVNDLGGLIHWIDEPAGTVTPFLDLRDYPELAINNAFHGLQSFAFHPDFHVPEADGYGLLYTLFSSNATTAEPDFSVGEATAFHTVLLEWRTTSVGAAIFVPAETELPYREILRINQPNGGHVGGLIAFNPTVTPGDPDYGNLYLALGDGAAGGGAADPFGNGQNPNTPYAAIVRIDPLGKDSANGRYGLVSANAFAADGDPGTLAEVYCHGLRNPQRFSWDIVSTFQYIADIGHDAMEEIDLAANGANFGWKAREGSLAFAGGDPVGLTDPIAEYDHLNFVEAPAPATANRAITIGDVARGTCITGLDGHLLAADFVTGILLLLPVESGEFDGGQSRFRELRVHTGDGVPTRMLDIINAERRRRGGSDTARADLRFSVNTPGRVFLINKQDNMVRRLVSNEAPTMTAAPLGPNETAIHFNGIFQSSPDLQSWADLLPQPASPYTVDSASGLLFLRNVQR